MNNKKSDLYFFLNDKKNGFLLIAMILCVTAIKAMDLDLSTVLSSPLGEQNTRQNKYQQTLTNLMSLVNSQPTNDFDIAEKLVDLKESAETSIQKALVTTLDTIWNKEQDSANLKTQFYQAYDSMQAQKLSICFEGFVNQLRPNQNDITSALITLSEIESLLPANSIIRTNKIKQVKTILNNRKLDTKSISKCGKLMKEIENLSFSPESPNKMLENSMIQVTNLAKQGKSFPEQSGNALTYLQNAINYLLAQKNLSDSLKIYILQLMWWTKMRREGNTIVQNYASQATVIANALRRMRAILPSIIHNAGKVAKIKFHDQKNNKKSLDTLISEKTIQDKNFLKFLEQLITERDKPKPTYNATQPYRKPDNSTAELAKKGINSTINFPLTEESLKNPFLPGSFKPLLEEYLKLNTLSPEEKEQRVIKRKIEALTERLDFLKNYIQNISSPKTTKHKHFQYKREDLPEPKERTNRLPTLPPISEYATKLNIDKEITSIEERIKSLNEQLTNKRKSDPATLDIKIKQIQQELTDIAKGKEALSEQKARLDNFKHEITQPIQDIINEEHCLNNIVTTAHEMLPEINTLHSTLVKLSDSINNRKEEYKNLPVPNNSLLQKKDIVLSLNSLRKEENQQPFTEAYSYELPNIPTTDFNPDQDNQNNSNVTQKIIATSDNILQQSNDGLQNIQKKLDEEQQNLPKQAYDRTVCAKIENVPNGSAPQKYKPAMPDATSSVAQETILPADQIETVSSEPNVAIAQRKSGLIRALLNRFKNNAIFTRIRQLIDENVFPRNKDIESKQNEFSQTSWLGIVFGSVTWFFGLFKKVLF